MVINSTYKQFIVLCCISFFLFSCEKSITNSQNELNVKVKTEQPSVLIFSKTEGYRHKSIEVGVKAVIAVAKSINLTVVVSESSAIFNDKKLQNFSSIIFLNTTGDILNNQQQLALERYIQAGGGFVGIHSATDTEPEWHWYGRMIGGRFKSHPKIQTAMVNVISDHSIVDGIPKKFELEDEWYNFKSLSDKRHNLMLLDETSYEGGENGSVHPISWFQEFDGGRVFYTGLGHKKETYNNPIFIKQLTQGLKYTVGNNKLNYKKSRPLSNRFSKNTLVSGLSEPVSFDLTKNSNKVLWVNRKGGVYWFNLNTKKKMLAGTIPLNLINDSNELGMQAVVLDPHFDANNYAYFMFNTKYKEKGNQLVQRVSRFTLNKDSIIDLTSEIVMLNIPNDACCQTTGNMKFDKQGYLYIAIGDNTKQITSSVNNLANHSKKEINNPLNYSGNPQDLRGKILRITPEISGVYSIPPGNLFEDSTQGKPEIYVMGTHTPSTLAYDNVAETLYYGDVGPEYLHFPLINKVKGFDEINKVRRAGNFGWPLFNGFNNNYNSVGQNKYGSRLPPAQEPIIAYSSKQSNHLPELGAGLQNVLVAGIYRSSFIPSESINSYPSYYDGRLFISDVMREWIKVVSFDSSGSVVKVEDFASDIQLSSPIALQFNEDGELFILEYNTKKNGIGSNGTLSKIEYFGEGNRSPVAEITIGNTKGAKPFSLIANANSSTDPDNDDLTYRWQIKKTNTNTPLSELKVDAKEETYSGSDINIKLINNGKYALVLAVTDANKAVTYTQKIIEVGNAPPNIDITLDKNQSFIWPDGADYQVSILDVEDGTLNNGIDLNDVYVSLKSFEKVSLPSVNLNGLSAEGYISPQNHAVKYELSVDYTDKGLPGFDSIKVTKVISLFPSKLILANVIDDNANIESVNKGNGELVSVNLSNNGSYIGIGTYDLTSVSSLKLVQYFAEYLNKDAILEIRMGSPKGAIIAEGKFTDYTRLKAPVENEIQELTLDIVKPINKTVSLFIVVNELDMPELPAFRLGTIEFIRN